MFYLVETKLFTLVAVDCDVDPNGLSEVDVGLLSSWRPYLIQTTNLNLDSNMVRNQIA